MKGLTDGMMLDFIGRSISIIGTATIYPPPQISGIIIMLETNMLSLMSHYIFNIFVSSVRLYFILLFLCFETILRSFAVLSLDVFRKSANYNYRSFADYIFESLLIL